MGGIFLVMLGIRTVFAQDPAEPTASGINEIALFERTANELRVVEIYAGVDDEKSRRRHLERARLYELKSADFKRFILFSLRPKKLNEDNKLIREILRDLEIKKESDAYVSGIIPVYGNQIELNGKTWLLEKKPLIIKEKRKRPPEK
jgi:hypothetical protein